MNEEKFIRDYVKKISFKEIDFNLDNLEENKKYNPLLFFNLSRRGMFFSTSETMSYSNLKKERDEYIQNRWNERRARKLKAKLEVKEETTKIRRKI